jgi:hypothetical protein
MQTALDVLKLDSLTVIYPGQVDYLLERNVKVRSFQNLPSALEEF